MPPSPRHPKTPPQANKRFLVKLSGEALAGRSGQGLDEAALNEIVRQFDRARQRGVEVAVVLGGGNFVRGADLEHLDRVVADRMGMLATAINALALQEALRQRGLIVCHQSALALPFAEPLDPHRAREGLQRGEVVIFSGGTGNPLVTTDTAAALRAIEIKANILLKATHVDGVYSSDPQRDPGARRLKRVSYDEAIERRLGVMDLAALAICREYRMPVRVFNAVEPVDNLERALCGEELGTLIGP